jgi:DNA repair photolyase
VEGNDEKYSCRCWYDFRPGRALSRHCICVQYGYEPTRNPPSVETTLTPDHAKGVITQNDSPDIGFDYSINPYQPDERRMQVTRSVLEVLARCRHPSPQARLRAVKQLAGAGVPVGILVAPIIPALTDHEMERILEAAVDVGARWARQ